MDIVSNPKISHSLVWNLAWPVILANISLPLLSITNIAVMGHLPDPKYISSVALAETILESIYWGLYFLRMGTTGLTAQAFGANNSREIIASLFRGLIIAITLGFTVCFLQNLLFYIGFSLLDINSELKPLVLDYVSIRIWSVPAVLANYVMLGWLFGIQRPKSTLLIQIVTNAVNIYLSLFFVIDLGWGVKGVAIAAFIAELVGLLVGLIWITKIILQDFYKNIYKDYYHQITSKWQLDVLIKTTLNKEKVLEFFTTNANIFIRTILLYLSFAWFAAIGAKQGPTILACNVVLLTFIHFLAYALDGFAQAAEMLVGRTIGAKDLEGYNDSVRISTFWAAIFAILFALFYFFSGNLLINLLTSIEEVRETARMFLPWLIIMPIINIWGYQLDGIFIGAIETKSMRDVMFIAFGVYAIGIQVFMPVMGNHGLWFAFVIFMVVRAVGLYLKLPNIREKIVKID